jgi:pyruvate formate lyase activating enzyme
MSSAEHRPSGPAVADAPEPAPAGWIFNIQRYSVRDGPGIRTTVFFKGCPLACWWCHNPESHSFHPEPVYFADRCRTCGECVEICPEHAIHRVDGHIVTDTWRCRRCGTCVEICSAAAREIAGHRVSVREVLAEIERDVVFFDESGGGVTLSGGEPLSQPRFAAAILDACNERRIHTVLETCGFSPPALFSRIAAKAALVLYDLKLIDPQKHRHYTGASNEWILENLKAIADCDRLLVRIPLVPGVNDSDSDADDFAGFLSEAQIRRVEVLPYHRFGAEKYRRLGKQYPLDTLAPPANGEILRFQTALVRANIEVTTGG